MSAIPNIPETVSQTVPVAVHQAYSERRGSLKADGYSHLVDGAQANGFPSGAVPKYDANPLKRSWKLHDKPVENHRPIKVIVIGAGYSGIYCGIRIPERIRNCELTIYEKNAGFGGAWYENRYPGCACDVPCK